MRAVRNVTTIVALSLLLVSATGCLAVAAAAGAGAGVAYAKGDRLEMMDADPAAIATAAEAAFLDLGMAVTHRSSRFGESTVVARTSGDRKVEVVATSRSAHASEVSVRAGTWGDDAIHARVIEKIREHLVISQTASQTPADAASGG